MGRSRCSDDHGVDVGRPDHVGCVKRRAHGRIAPAYEPDRLLGDVRDGDKLGFRQFAEHPSVIWPPVPQPDQTHP